MREMMQNAKERIVQAFADLKEKERLIRERAFERAQLLAEQRKRGMGPATN
jgi:hypothetical protein